MLRTVIRRTLLKTTNVVQRRLSGGVVMSKDRSTELYSKEKATHFGYKNVNESDKADLVHDVFTRVAPKYDLMNDAMSLGIHRCWKDTFVETLCPTPGIRLLDMAGGTGDVAFRVMKRLALSSEIDSEVIVSDINDDMLEVGRQRAAALGLNTRGIRFEVADAEQLPFPDNTFDAYTIAFGIRNCVHVDRTLEEALRVLRVGGRFLCLEFSNVDNSIARWFYDRYSFQVMPVLGTLLLRDWRSYQYLVESIRRFPKQEEFKQMIEEAGFSMVSYTNLSMGVAAIHSGFKL